MFSHLELKNYRTFSAFTATDLVRVNLLVGANNSGKTSLLGSLMLLLDEDPANAIWWDAYRRDEQLNEIEVEISHLFHGHKLSPGQSFLVTADSRSLRCEVVPRTTAPERPAPERQPYTRRVARRHERGEHQIELLINARHEKQAYTNQIPLKVSGTLEEPYTSASRKFSKTPYSTISPHSDRAADMAELWNKVVLTTEESRVVDALRIIEPTIERIAFLAEGGDAENIYLKFRDFDDRIPIGSMGDGIWRFLAMALNLTNAAGGYLLVDEIDTGLHYSVMLAMWRLIIETARRLNIQVFATTHSSDCVRALAWLYEEQPEIRDEISVHRVQKGLSHTVRYSADELLVAARQHIEVR